MSQDQEEHTLRMGAVEYRMPQGICLDDIDNCWPQWQRFKLSFRNFILAAGFERLSEARKAAILINCIGQQAQELYFNVLKIEGKEKLEEIIEIFDGYFKPKQNEVINSYNLNKRNQEDGESFDAFYTSIRKLAENCNFGELKDRMLRDKIVIGVRDQRMQQKLLEINDLTLQKAVDICRSAELSREFVKTLNNPEVHALQTGRPTQQHHFSKDKYFTKKDLPQGSNNNKVQYNRNFYRCRKCNTDHRPMQCPAYGKTCSNCKRMNHFKVGCTFSNNNKRVDHINNADSDEASNNVHDL